MTAQPDQARDDRADEAGNSIHVVRDTTGATITLRGDIDDDDREAAQKRLAVLVENGVDRIVFDLAAVRFADSSLLNLMIRARATLLGRGTVVIGGPVPPAVERLFEITGVGKVFDRHPSVEAALEADHG